MTRPEKGHERLPPMPDSNEQTAKPVAARLVQQMPNHAYRQRGTTPRNAAVSSTTGLFGKLEDWTETKDILARPDTPRRAEHRCGCRANIGKGMSAVGRGPTADIPFVKTKTKGRTRILHRRRGLPAISVEHFESPGTH